VTFDICKLGMLDIIVGSPWLHCHNPDINWITGEVKLSRCPETCGYRKHKFTPKRQKNWRTADRWELMEYLWEEERAVDFAYWLEDNRIKNENLGYWEQMKHPSGYYNSDAFPFTPLVPHNRVDMITSQGIAKNLMKEQAEHGPWTYQPKIRALEKLLVTEQVPARFHLSQPRHKLDNRRGKTVAMPRNLWL
jgi:hypothetical protein